ncbi:MAG: CapA family protein [Candidatus Geothermincolales bacterium]
MEDVNSGRKVRGIGGLTGASEKVRFVRPGLGTGDARDLPTGKTGKRLVLRFYLAAFLVLLGAFVFLYPRLHRQEPAVTSSGRVTLAVDVPPQMTGTWRSLLDRLADGPTAFEVIDAGDRPDILVSDKAPPPEGYVPTSTLEFQPLKIRIAGWEKVVGEPHKVFIYSSEELSPGEGTKRDEVIGLLETWATSGFPTTTLGFAGDIIPSRTVAKQMGKRGVLFPFRDAAPLLSDADLAWGNLECPLSDRYPPPTKGVSFIAPTETVKGLELCGFDVLSLANNHSTNFGTAPFLDTLKTLEEKGMRYVGGGRDSGEAYSPLILEVKGIRFAFLAFNCVAGSVNAGPGKPGVAWLDLPPYAPFGRDDEESVKRKVMEAREQADFLVVSFHWGEEYRYRPSDSQVKLAHVACDAGADMVVSSHPHCIQPVEIYGHSFIAYSLGNFVFDQMFADYTREGFVLRCRLRGNRLEEAELAPYLIHDYCRPVPMDPASARRFADKMRAISGL